ncbi:hypothetical protein RAK27_09830 [Carnobacterium maltaromaticum]|uniref:Uncharacterized protein n=1 Tax=Carnobacterium maltaromaticum TaxID=2751 RepID=A0AAW9K443_CARML|nr:hypothetical protein [Carnobacterium maltaromaticum]MDZ5758954.1 hypothetical protein [Carnobacterium maltaromaticum]
MNTNYRNQKWKELSAQRMTRILYTTDLIANLSSHNYEYEEEWLIFLLESFNQKGEEIKKIFVEPETRTENNLSSDFLIPNVPDIETLNKKQKKFIEIAQKRMSNLYKELNYLSRLANTKNYTYDLMDVDYLFEIYDAKGLELKKWFPPFKNERIENDINISNYPSEG